MVKQTIISAIISAFAIRRRRDIVVKPGAILLFFFVFGDVMEYLVLEESKHLSNFDKSLFVIFITGPFVALSFIIVNHLNKLQQQLATLAMTDVLTELPNRRAFMEKTETTPEGFLLILDADHFKAINDTYGHAVGDACLQAIAKHLLQNTRKDDIVARIGGEEFAAFLPNTAVSEVDHIGRRLTGPISVIPASDKEVLLLTLSIGAAYRKHDESVEKIFQRSDTALYMAKESGRARLIVWTEAMQENAA